MKKNVFSLQRIMTGLGIVLFAGTLLTACMKENDNDNNNSQVAGLMAFNLVPDQPGVSFVLSGTSVTGAPLAYTNFTGTYVGVYPGNRTVEFYGNGSSSPLAGVSGMFEPQKYYSAFAVGANNVYRNILVQDNFDDLSGSSGQAYIRYINAIPDSSKPVVKITTGGATPVNDQPAFTYVSAFAAVAPGQVTIDVSNGSTIDVDRTITVEAKKVYTVLLNGIPGNTSTPVEIKFITNGELDETDGQRTASSARTTSIQ